MYISLVFQNDKDEDKDKNKNNDYDNNNHYNDNHYLGYSHCSEKSIIQMEVDESVLFRETISAERLVNELQVISSVVIYWIVSELWNFVHLHECLTPILTNSYSMFTQTKVNYSCADVIYPLALSLCHYVIQHMSCRTHFHLVVPSTSIIRVIYYCWFMCLLVGPTIVLFFPSQLWYLA